MKNRFGLQHRGNISEKDVFRPRVGVCWTTRRVANRAARLSRHCLQCRMLGGEVAVSFEKKESSPLVVFLQWLRSILKRRAGSGWVAFAMKNATESVRGLSVTFNSKNGMIMGGIRRRKKVTNAGGRSNFSVRAGKGDAISRWGERSEAKSDTFGEGGRKWSARRRENRFQGGGVAHCQNHLAYRRPMREEMMTQAGTVEGTGGDWGASGSPLMKSQRKERKETGPRSVGSGMWG